MARSTDDIVVFSCSVFRQELEALRDRGALHQPIEFADSMLHLKPASLHKVLGKEVERLRQQGRRIVLVYGDCHAFMDDMCRQPGVVRTRGLNCPALLLGPEKAKALTKEGAFFLLPEWARRWQEVFKNLIGLPDNEVRSLFQESHKQLIYLDTGVTPVPTEELEACAAFLDLPYSVMPVDLTVLTTAIHEAMEELSHAG